MTTLTAVSAMTASIVRRVCGWRRSNDRPVACGVWMVADATAFQPHPQGDEQKTEHEEGGDEDEDDQARVGVVEQAKKNGNDQRDEDDGTHRRQHGAGHGQWMAG